MLKKERRRLFLKITVSIMLTVFIMMTPNYKQAEGNEIRLGDINGDGNINLTDLVCMLRHIAAEKSNKNEEWLLTKEQIKAGDIIKDEKIDSSDVLALLRYMAANKSTSVAEKHEEWLELEKTEDTDKTEEIQKDKIGPKIEKIEAISKAGNYKTGEEIQIKVTFDEKIYAGKNKVALSNKTIPILNISFGEGEIKHPYVEENSKIEKSIIYKYQITGEDKGELKVTGAKAFDGTKTIYDEAGNEVTLVAGRDLTGNKITANEETGNSSITKIVLDKKEITLDINGAKTAKITAIVTPSETNLTWTSSNNKVAIVDEKTGIVTALEEGKTDIIVKAADGIQETCKVTVKNSGVEVTEISLNKTSLEIGENDGERLSATVQPANATNQKITWSSSNSNIATVNDGGFVTGKKEGTATITAKTANGKTATCQVVVKNSIIEVENVRLDRTSLKLQENEGERLTATVQPSNATNPKITWSSSNSNIATVNDGGFVTSRKEGTATITAKTANGKTATCKVTVKNVVIDVESIVIDKTSLNLEKDETVKLIATIKPTKATDKTITWKSSNTKVAIVNNDGTVKAMAAGSATITAKASNGKTANCTVKVTDSIVKKLDGKNITLPLGDKVYFLDTQFIGSNGRTVGSDCMIIESNGKYGMIDTATSGKSSRIIKYLKDLKINELEFVLITHDHSDHIGGFVNISNQIKIKKLYIKKRSKNGTIKAVKQAKKKGTEICYVDNTANQKITLGNINFKLYNTSDNIGSRRNINENVNSIVALATINGQAVCFAGDIGNYSGINAENTVAKQIQKDLKAMGKSQVDVYKAAHHSYNENNAATALKYIQPRNVVVTNQKNRSGTTSAQSRLREYVNKAKGKMYFTDTGTVILNITNQGKITFKQLTNYY